MILLGDEVDQWFSYFAGYAGVFGGARQSLAAWDDLPVLRKLKLTRDGKAQLCVRHEP